MDASGDEGAKVAMDFGSAVADGAAGIAAADGAVVPFVGAADSSAAAQGETAPCGAGGAEASIVEFIGDVVPSAPRSSKPQRTFWGTYSAIVLGTQPPSRPCASPTRGARNLGKLLRDSSPLGVAGSETPSVLSETSLSALGGSSNSGTPYPADESGSDAPMTSTEIVEVKSQVGVGAFLPEELPETAQDSEPFEVRRARERRARAKANAAKVVAQAREKQEAAAALELMEAAVAAAPSPGAKGEPVSTVCEDTAQRAPPMKRRRLLTKQKSADHAVPPNVQPTRQADGDSASAGSGTERQRPRWKALAARPVQEGQVSQDVALPLQTQQSSDGDLSSQQDREAQLPAAGMVVESSPQKLEPSPCAPTELDSDDDMPLVIKQAQCRRSV